MRRPIDRPAKITGDTATHAEYGVGPATDYALPRGAWVIAPFDMTLTAYRSATGGWALAGGGCNFQHLIDDSRRTGWVAEGTPIAQIAGAGDSPGTSWTGPHLHTWVSAGSRMSFEGFVAASGFASAGLGEVASPTFTASAGGDLTPFDPEEDDTMAKVYEDRGNAAPFPNTGKFYIGAPGAWLTVDNRDFGGDRFVRDLLASKFGPIEGATTNELVGIRKTWLALAPAASSASAIDYSTLAKAIAKEIAIPTAGQNADELAKRLAG